MCSTLEHRFPKLINHEESYAMRCCKIKHAIIPIWFIFNLLKCFCNYLSGEEKCPRLVNNIYISNDNIQPKLVPSLTPDPHPPKNTHTHKSHLHAKILPTNVSPTLLSLRKQTSCPPWAGPVPSLAEAWGRPSEVQAQLLGIPLTARGLSGRQRLLPSLLGK